MPTLQELAAYEKNNTLSKQQKHQRIVKLTGAATSDLTGAATSDNDAKKRITEILQQYLFNDKKQSQKIQSLKELVDTPKSTYQDVMENLIKLYEETKQPRVTLFGVGKSTLRVKLYHIIARELSYPQYDNIDNISINSRYFRSELQSIPAKLSTKPDELLHFFVNSSQLTEVEEANKNTSIQTLKTMMTEHIAKTKSILEGTEVSVEDFSKGFEEIMSTSNALLAQRANLTSAAVLDLLNLLQKFHDDFLNTQTKSYALSLFDYKDIDQLLEYVDRWDTSSTVDEDVLIKISQIYKGADWTKIAFTEVEMISLVNSLSLCGEKQTLAKKVTYQGKLNGNLEIQKELNHQMTLVHGIAASYLLHEEILSFEDCYQNIEQVNHVLGLRA